MTVRKLLLVVGVLAVRVVPLAAQNPPVRVLAKPSGEFPVPFIRIGSVHELPDGRVIVGEVHLRDGTLQVVNFATGTAAPITRKGAGPGEFDGRPEQLLTFTGDTVAMYDGGNARFLLIGPDGKPARTEPFKPAWWTNSLAWGDKRGRVYADEGARASEPYHVADSGFVVRLSMSSGKLDTIATRRVSKTDVTTFSARGMTGVRTEEVPFAPHDDWAAFPDGRVAVIRGQDYHVDFYRSDGTRYSGPPTRYDRVPITQADKDSVHAARSPKPGPDGKITLPLAPLIINPSVWYPFKAPFGENSAWASPAGELWVAIAQPVGSRAETFDVFDAAGKRVRRVVLPAGSRLIRLGAHALYAVRVDSDDEQILQRFDLSLLH